MPSTLKLPRGLHQFYLSDSFTNALFWFMCGLVFVEDYSQTRAAKSFREFVQLDEDNASTYAIVMKFRRQLTLYRETIGKDRDLINLNWETRVEDLMDHVERELKDGVLREDKTESS